MRPFEFNKNMKIYISVVATIFKRMALSQFSVPVALSDTFVINYLDLYKVCRTQEIK